MDIFLVCFGVIQYFDMHALVDVTVKRRRTSLGTGATESSNGAHEHNEGHKSSNSNADDHRHRERLCRKQQGQVSYNVQYVQLHTTKSTIQGT